MIKSILPTHNFVYDGLQIYVYHANKGEGLPKHEHTFSHAIICNSGSCWVRKENKESLMNKNSQPIDLPANEWHEIEAEENGTVFVNIFAEGKP
jgi:quercetin dioxygenase-like cupin family protein